eukprot:12583163-Alexandrium_andersonii.AAC.1
MIVGRLRVSLSRASAPGSILGGGAAAFAGGGGGVPLPPFPPSAGGGDFPALTWRPAAAATASGT